VRPTERWREHEKNWGVGARSVGARNRRRLPHTVAWAGRTSAACRSVAPAPVIAAAALVWSPVVGALAVLVCVVGQTGRPAACAGCAVAKCAPTSRHLLGLVRLQRGSWRTYSWSLVSECRRCLCNRATARYCGRVRDLACWRDGQGGGRGGSDTCGHLARPPPSASFCVHKTAPSGAGHRRSCRHNRRSMRYRRR